MSPVWKTLCFIAVVASSGTDDGFQMYAAAQSTPAVTPGAAAPQSPVGGPLDVIAASSALDTDRDGLVSAAEFAAFQTWGAQHFNESEVGVDEERVQDDALIALGEAGAQNCRCIDPWRHHNVSEPGACLNYTDPATGLQHCVPNNYGAGRCETWDATLAPSCADVDGRPLASAIPDWCSRRWCYINYTECWRPHSQAAYTFPTGAYRGEGLHYSYETCGNLDTYAEDMHYSSLKGSTLRVTLPVDSGSRHALYTDPHTGERTGSMIDFMNEVAVSGGFTWTLRSISNASRLLYSSSYTQCVHDVALNETDLCIGPFWLTPERLLMSRFSVSIYSNTFLLVVQQPNTRIASVKDFILRLQEHWKVPFRPFTKHAWWTIGCVTFFMSVVMVSITRRAVSNDEDRQFDDTNTAEFVGSGLDHITRDVDQMRRDCKADIRSLGVELMRTSRIEEVWKNVLEENATTGAHDRTSGMSPTQPLPHNQVAAVLNELMSGGWCNGTTCPHQLAARACDECSAGRKCGQFPICQWCRLCAADFKLIVESIDVDHSEGVEFEEFATWWLERKDDTRMVRRKRLLQKHRRALERQQSLNRQQSAISGVPSDNGQEGQRKQIGAGENDWSINDLGESHKNRRCLSSNSQFLPTIQHYTYSVYLGFLGLMTGSPAHGDGSTPAARVVKLSFAFFTLIVYASYTACTAVLLLQQRHGVTLTVDALEADIDSRLCVLDAAKHDLMLRRPGFVESRIVTSDTHEETLRQLQQGECDALLTYVDVWEKFKTSKQYCNLTAPTGRSSDLTISNAMPVRPELEDSISYVIAKLRVAGRFNALRSKHIRLRSQPSACANFSWIESGDKTGKDGSMLGVADLTFPLFFSVTGTLCGVLLHFAVAPFVRFLTLRSDVQTLEKKYPLVAAKGEPVKLAGWCHCCGIVSVAAVKEALDYSRHFERDGSSSASWHRKHSMVAARRYLQRAQLSIEKQMRAQSNLQKLRLGAADKDFVMARMRSPQTQASPKQLLVVHQQPDKPAARTAAAADAPASTERILPQGQDPRP